ncbi:MAG: family 10 glycosylhydrolase [Phycisphaerae bacterium]|nr:family 10 glycosylhydrolase [Phycisphaerae bacterium]
MQESKTSLWLLSACCLILASAGHSQAAPGNASDQATKQVRKKAAHRQRRIIVNNDGNDCRQRKPGEPVTAENFLSKRTSPLVGSHVDAIFYCTGIVNVYTHHSKETELRTSADRGVDDWAPELIKTGRDSLQIMVDFGHKQGWEVFWSMRMNDTHDSGDPAMLCKWKKENPKLLMGKKGDKLPHGGHRWSALNYALPDVRDKIFRILQDVATRYDVDGLELDFWRHPVYFKPQMTGEPVTQEQCDLMTGLIRRVREMVDEVAAKRKRPMLIAVRVPDSIGFAKAIGLDLVRWLEDGLIDVVSGGGYYHFEPWENLVALGKKYDVPVYAALSASRIVSPSKPESQGDLQAWRGEALRAWKAGVSGIYTFNRFNPRDPIFREIGDPALLETKERTYTFNSGKVNDYWVKGAKRFVKPENK